MDKLLALSKEEGMKTAYLESLGQTLRQSIERHRKEYGQAAGMKFRISTVYGTLWRASTGSKSG